MFTGHIETTATIAEVRDGSLRITVDPAVPLVAGGAVCLDGVRLTMQSAQPGELIATVTDETRRRTTLDRVAAGTRSTSSCPWRPATGSTVIWSRDTSTASARYCASTTNRVAGASGSSRPSGCWPVWWRNPPSR